MAKKYLNEQCVIDRVHRHLVSLRKCMIMLTGMVSKFTIEHCCCLRTHFLHFTSCSFNYFFHLLVNSLQGLPTKSTRLCNYEAAVIDLLQ